MNTLGANWDIDVDYFHTFGFAAYLEPLEPEIGALRVIPGSHRPELGSTLRELGASGMTASALPGYALSTEPGDVIVFDEHLFHASLGGSVRKQWRVDFVRDPVGPDGERLVRDYFQAIYPADWNGGYDVVRYPSYSDHWRRSGRPAADRLEALGVYQLAARQEQFCDPSGKLVGNRLQ